MSKNSEIFGQNVQKGPQEPVQHEIDVEKWFSNGYSD